MQLKTSNEFFNLMRVLTRELFEFGVPDTNNLITVVCNMEPFPFPYLKDLRLRYSEDIRPYLNAFKLVKENFNNLTNGMKQEASKGANGNGLSDLDEDLDPFDDQFFIVSICSVISSANMKIRS